MTPSGRPLSENGKVIAICLIIPLLWPFLPVVLLCMLGDKIRNAYWDWRYRRAEHREGYEMSNKPLPWGINRIGSPYHPDVHCQMPNGQWAHAVCEPHDMGRFRAAWWVLTGRAYAFLWPKAGELEGIWQRLNPPEIRPSPRPFVPQADSRNLPRSSPK